jgi:hypothetical protein
MVAKSCEKDAKKHSCDCCAYLTTRKSSMTKHLLSAKHLARTKSINFEQKSCDNQVYTCKKCNKTYKARNSLWYHEKKCNYQPEKKHKLYEKEDIVDVLMKENIDFKNIIMEVVKNNTEFQKELQKQNVDFQKQILDVCKNSNMSITNNNSNNKTFNLQVFLNEQCKDAMNLKEFIDSMTLELSDLEEVGTLGYVEGISNIIIRKLGELDIYKRPIHCSDGKREIMFVKDDNVWEKENDTNDKLRLAIKHVTYKNSSLLVPWSQKHPNCMNTQHHLNDVYVKMIGQAMGGKGEFVDSENKIMKKIAKAVLIHKT